MCGGVNVPEQMDLLAGVPLRMDVARSLGEIAMNLAADKAEIEGMDFDGARRFVLGWLARHGETSGEDLTIAMREHGFHANELRAYGAVTRTLQQRGQIKCLRSDLPRRFGHGTSGGKLWALAHRINER